MEPFDLSNLELTLASIHKEELNRLKSEKNRNYNYDKHYGTHA